MALGTSAKEAVKQIVGIVLVRNEDRFVRQSVTNILGFCDRILLVDNGSQDQTPFILKELAASDPGKISFHAIGNSRESHDLLKPYAGTPTWVFAVDGDEIYDPERLDSFRIRLLSGEFNSYWMILSNVHHCRYLDHSKGVAEGYLTPPARSITKLYNFAAIRSWNGNTNERLHGGNPDFLPGYEAESKRNLYFEYQWETSPLRCLHVCFLSRSSLDRSSTISRKNILEKSGLFNRLRMLARRMLKIPEVSTYKQERYARGESLSVPTAPFFKTP